MNTLIQPLADVNERARNALVQALGVSDTLRFLNQFRAGSGDYTAEREHLFEGESVKSLVESIKARRNTKNPNISPSAAAPTANTA
jgi:hypothetical protein